MFYDPNFVHEYGGFPPDRNYRGMGPRGGMYGGGLPPRAPRFPYGGRGMGMGVSPFPPAPFGGPMQTTQVHDAIISHTVPSSCYDVFCSIYSMFYRTAVECLNEFAAMVVRCLARRD